MDCDDIDLFVYTDMNLSYKEFFKRIVEYYKEKDVNYIEEVILNSKVPIVKLLLNDIKFDLSFVRDNIDNFDTE